MKDKCARFGYYKECSICTSSIHENIIGFNEDSNISKSCYCDIEVNNMRHAICLLKWMKMNNCSLTYGTSEYHLGYSLNNDIPDKYDINILSKVKIHFDVWNNILNFDLPN